MTGRLEVESVEQFSQNEKDPIMPDSAPAWYPRTVFFVADVAEALAHYTGPLGFGENWRHEEEGLLVAAQVERDGLEIILNRNLDKAGGGRIFLALKRGQVGPLMDEFQARGVEGIPGFWGMPIVSVGDGDGNELFFFDDRQSEAD